MCKSRKQALTRHWASQAWAQLSAIWARAWQQDIKLPAQHTQNTQCWPLHNWLQMKPISNTEKKVDFTSSKSCGVAVGAKSNFLVDGVSELLPGLWLLPFFALRDQLPWVYLSCIDHVVVEKARKARRCDRYLQIWFLAWLFVFFYGPCCGFNG